MGCRSGDAGWEVYAFPSWNSAGRSFRDIEREVLRGRAMPWVSQEKVLISFGCGIQECDWCWEFAKTNLYCPSFSLNRDLLPIHTLTRCTWAFIHSTEGWHTHETAQTKRDNHPKLLGGLALRSRKPWSRLGERRIQIAGCLSLGDRVWFIRRAWDACRRRITCEGANDRCLHYTKINILLLRGYTTRITIGRILRLTLSITIRSFSTRWIIITAGRQCCWTGSKVTDE